MQSNVLLPQKATSCAGLDLNCKSFSRSKPCASCFWLFAALWLKSLQSKCTRILPTRPRNYTGTQTPPVLVRFSPELDNSWTQLRKTIIMCTQIYLQYSSLWCLSGQSILGGKDLAASFRWPIWVFHIWFELASQSSILYRTCFQNMHELGSKKCKCYSTVVTCTFLILIFSFDCLGHKPSLLGFNIIVSVANVALSWV